jgi:hypothetical protein
MNNFVKLSRVKQNASLLKRLREEEMKRVNGGNTCTISEPLVLDYGVIEPGNPKITSFEEPIVQEYGVMPPDGF